MTLNAAVHLWINLFRGEVPENLLDLARAVVVIALYLKTGIDKEPTIIGQSHEPLTDDDAARYLASLLPPTVATPAGAQPVVTALPMFLIKPLVAFLVNRLIEEAVKRAPELEPYAREIAEWLKSFVENLLGK